VTGNQLNTDKIELRVCDTNDAVGMSLRSAGSVRGWRCGRRMARL
jgi:hypothetical protein